MLSSTNWENLKVPCNAHKKDAARYHSVTWTVRFHSEPWSTCQWMVCHRRIHNCYSLVCQKDRFKGCDSCRGTCQCNGRSSFQVAEEIRTTCTIFKKSFAGISFKWHQEAIQGHCSDCEKRIKSVFLHLGTFINCHLAWYITVLQTPNKLLLLTSKDLQGVTCHQSGFISSAGK